MRRPIIAVVPIAVALAMVLGGCGQKPAATQGGPAPSGGPKVKLEVMVPCGEVGPMSEIIKRFQAANPDIVVDWIPENMVTITAKILDRKVEPDVTLSMGDLEMDLLEKAGLLADGSRTKIAENSLCIMVPAGNPAGVKTIQDLAKPAVKSIAIPDPKENSVGLHAIEALKKAGVWEKVEGKVFFSKFAADSKDVTAKGQAEASIGYYPCAVEVHIPGQPPAKPKNLVLQAQVPADLYPAFSCEAAILKDAKQPEAARKFMEFMVTPESQKSFLQWQFIADVTKTPPPAG
ncbi:MAG: molybdate ABC transporter substrate-binding protein [Armatimonadota bacterium]